MDFQRRLRTSSFQESFAPPQERLLTPLEISRTPLSKEILNDRSMKRIRFYESKSSLIKEIINQCGFLSVVTILPCPGACVSCAFTFHFQLIYMEPS